MFISSEYFIKLRCTTKQKTMINIIESHPSINILSCISRVKRFCNYHKIQSNNQLYMYWIELVSMHFLLDREVGDGGTGEVGIGRGRSSSPA